MHQRKSSVYYEYFRKNDTDIINKLYFINGKINVFACMLISTFDKLSNIEHLILQMKHSSVNYYM